MTASRTRTSAMLAASVGALVLFVAQACSVQVGDSQQGQEDWTSVAEEVTTTPMSRAEILALAQTAVGYSYWWGHGRWDPTNKSHPGKCSGNCSKCSHWAYPTGGSEFGADCSGFVAQAWQVPTAGSPKVDRHPYSTYNFRFEKTHWYPIKKSQLKPGDALVYHTGTHGHVALFDGWSGGGKAVAYECSGCSIGCVHKPRSFASYYIAIRRRGVEDTPPDKPAKGRLEKASCSKGLVGWAQDPDTAKKAIDVVLTFDGPINGKNVKKTSVKAGQHRSDLCKKLGSCNHGFALAIPSSLKDGKKHSVYAYAVNAGGKGKKLLVGAPRTLSCKPATRTLAKADDPSSSCSHAECSSGPALTKDCSPCADAVCLTQPSCCDAQNGSWDASCVDLAGETEKACRGVCAGGPSSCAHSECEAGDGLGADCSACAAHVCKRDPYCCSDDKWDWICAKEAKEDPWCSCGEPL